MKQKQSLEVLLQMYNAINGSAYTNPNDLVTTMEDAASTYCIEHGILKRKNRWTMFRRSVHSYRSIRNGRLWIF